jgi:hypothetical protein
MVLRIGVESGSRGQLGWRSYFGIAYDAPTRARFATDSIASTILE